MFLAHEPLSAVSNLHLREHFGSGLGWMKGGPAGVQDVERHFSSFSHTHTHTTQSNKPQARVQVCSHLSRTDEEEGHKNRDAG